MGYCSSTGRASNRRVWLGSILGLFGCAKRQPLPVYATVPRFTLTSQDGAPFGTEQLAGKPWLGSLFFATCTGPCPRLNRQIQELQERTYNFKGLPIVSITVDPAQDTPEALAAYAKRYSADPARWRFLTGARDTISAIARDDFQVGELDTSRTHSTRVMLVDGQGRVRGHYPVNEKEELDALLRGISQLYEEGS